MLAIFKQKRENGFTLIELMITMAVMGLMLTSISVAMKTQFDSYMTQDNVNAVQADVRMAADLLTRDIRSAGFAITTGNNAVSAASANSITLNLATGPSTFLTSTTIINGVVTVQSGTEFQAGQTFNMIDLWSKTILLSGTIATVAGNSLTLKDNLGALVVPPVSPLPALTVGDLVVSPGAAGVTYSLAGTQLTRNGVPLSNNIQSLNFIYILTSGGPATTVAAASLNTIAAVQFTLTGLTTLNVANQAGGVARTRSIQTVVALKNPGCCF
jgi:prepilin-type N-terminal cleavage/methylation domain-containing protein